MVSGARYLAAGPDGERFYRLERPTGSFRRSVALPTAATPEMVHASVEDGVLTVLVPKTRTNSLEWGNGASHAPRGGSPTSAGLTMPGMSLIRALPHSVGH